jgi:glycosyltransferase involved in cell wall biosynthesis
MKILLVTNSLAGGGKERQIIELAKVLLKESLDFKVICFSAEITVAGNGIIADRLIIVNRKNGYFKTQQRYFSVIKQFKPDIVHVWDNYGAKLSVIPKFFLKFKLVDGSIRGARRYLKRLIYMFITNPFTSKVVANSLAGLKSTYKKLNSKNIVIYNGFDSNRTCKLDKDVDFKKKLSIADKKIVGMIANIRAAKDYTGFLKVAEIVVSKRKDVAFVSLGYGKLNNELLINISPETKSHLYFLGKTDNPEEYIKSFDIGLLLNDTRHGKEGISNSVMEYMAAGLPVIATDAGGTPEIVKEGVSGFLVPAFDYEFIAQKILYLMDDEKKRVEMGLRGREILYEKFSLLKMGKEYIKLYTGLVNENQIPIE